MELDFEIRSLREFHALLTANPRVLVADVLDDLGRHVIAVGCREPLTGLAIQPSHPEMSESWREGLVANGLSSRVRGVMLCIEQAIAQHELVSPRIYAAEAVTAFALKMRGLFPRFVGSEFTTSPEMSEWLYPIPREDLQSLSFRENSFDIVSTNEVLEHVPSIDSALGEILRVLRPGGWHFGTVPFLYLSEQGEVRTRMEPDGSLIHCMEPQYHGDPMHESGALVFELPAWDLLERARAIGFSDAFMRFVTSAEYGILSEHIGGVLVFCCQK